MSTRTFPAAPRGRDQLRFFLGGYDLEMLTIRDLLDEVVPHAVHDRRLGWGARASSYRDELARCVAVRLTPVIVELADDLGLASSCIVVDHHGDRAAALAPTSLHQVFELLELPPSRWTRWFELVAANDRGHVRALVEAGAGPDEIVKIRAADRSAQGISAEEEEAGEAAAHAAERLAGGRLTVVRLPHARTATVTDRLHRALGGPGYDNLLVCSPDEVNFFGSGQLVTALDAAFPGGWCGGDLPERGFWGHGPPMPDALAFLADRLEREGAR